MFFHCTCISNKNIVGIFGWLKLYTLNGIKLFRKTMTKQFGKRDERKIIKCSEYPMSFSRGTPQLPRLISEEGHTNMGCT